MTAGWKPGDVAMCTLDNTLVFKLGTPGINRWAWSDGSVATLESGDVRPLLVIDPEDREQITTLLREYEQVGFPFVTRIDAMQDALRSLLPAHQPEEPTGRYAVVVDDKAREWCRIDTGQGAAWQLLGQPAGNAVPPYKFWGEVDAVRVLSEGASS